MSTKKPFFDKYAVLILTLVCFFTPFVLRGARNALRDTKNSVKDWLPKSFAETREMEWFWDHFAGERFILVTWPGCTGDESDQAYDMFLKKLKPAIPPSKQNVVFPEPESKDVGSTWLDRPYEFIGDRLGLQQVSNEHLNWGGQQEKWLRGFEGWFYITPTGDLYEFHGSDAPVSVGLRALGKLFGLTKLSGTLLVSFGPEDGPWYYKDPSRLQAQLFRSVTTGPNVLRDLTNEEHGVLRDDPREAMKRLKGALFGADGKQTALIVTLTPAGLKDFHRVLSRGVLGKEVGALYRIARECTIHDEDLHLGGPPVDNVAIDEEGTITLLRLVSLCVVLGLGLSYFCFRSVKATIMVFITGGFSAALGMSFVGWSGTPTDAIMMSMPSLVYVLGISGAVHMINHYREAVDDHGLVGAPGRAMLHGWKPAVLCNVTTSIGLLSLYTSQLIPIRNFGIFAAAGIMGTVVMMFTYLPSALQLYPLNLSKRQVNEDSVVSQWDAMLERFWARLGNLIIGHHTAVAIGCIVLISAVGYGATRINTSVNLLELFDAKAKILKDYSWIENNIGMLVPMEVVVKFDPQTLRKPESEVDDEPTAGATERHQLTFLDRMETVKAVQTEIDEYFGDKGSGVVGRSMSAVTFSPKLPGPTDSRIRRRSLNVGLEGHRDEFLRSDYLRLDQVDQSELWRVSLRVAAFRGVDYGEFVQDLRSTVEPVIAAQNARQQIIQTIEHRRQQQAENNGNSKRFFDIAVVLSDELVQALKPGNATDKGPASDESKTKDAKAADPKASPTKSSLATATDSKANKAKAESTKGSATADSATPFNREMDRDKVFVRNLNRGLKGASAQVKLISASSLSKDATTKLGEFDFVVMVGKLPTSIVDRVRRQAPRSLQANEYFSDVKPTDVQPVVVKRPVMAVYTGVVPIVYKAQRTLLASLIQSTFWSFITITPIMMLVAKNVYGGLIAMLPNALPVLMIFGAMGWLGIRVDIGSMMSASIALGVAVDDTIHFLSWFREELDHYGDRNQAILAAYRRCATPTTQAAIISGLGLSIFAFSTFVPTQRFGLLMLTILFAGVVAELIFYPALLASPLGAVFKPRKKAQPAAHEADHGDGDQERPATVPIDKTIGRPPTISKRIA